MSDDLSSSGISRRRYRAPQEDRGVLVEPGFASARELTKTNQFQDISSAPAIADWPWWKVVRTAREELLRKAYDYSSRYSSFTIESGRAMGIITRYQPIILSGHQPQLFHPGVWFKNFVAAKLAAATGGLAIHFLADGDVSTSSGMRVPMGSVEEPRVAEVLFDAPGEAIPWEERAVRDRWLFESFGRRAAEAIEPFVAEPLIRDYWPRVLRALPQHDGNLGRAFAQARHEIEHAWGLRTLEVPLGEVCDGEAFRRLSVHLIRQLPWFASIYNQAVDEYRRVYKVRSKAHPVPDLALDAEGCEAPLWIWSKENPRRRRLFARSHAGSIELTDRAGWSVTLPSANDAAVECLAEQAKQGIRIRPRALMTTLFARLFLSDLFIHGIGGGMYDQVTDEIIRRFFGVEPPAFMVATATLKLPATASNVSPDDLRRIDRELRETIWDPQRALQNSPDANVQRLIADKGRALTAAPTAQRHREIRAINAALQPAVEPLREELQRTRVVTVDALHRAALLGSREFSFVLHSERELRALFDL